MKHLRYAFVGVVAIALIFSCGCSTPLKQAQSLEKGGNYQDAVAAYEQVIQADPNSTEARQAQLQIARIYREQLNKPEDALTQYQQIAKQYPGTEEGAEALYQAGVQLYSAEKYEQASEVLNNVVNQYPNSQQSQYAQRLLAKTYEKAGNTEKASEVYASFARRSTDSELSVQALINKARVDQEMGKQESATQALQEAVKQYGNDPEAAAALEEAKTQLSEMGASVPEPVVEDTRAERRDARRERDRPRSSFYGNTGSAAKATTGYTNSFNVSPEDLMRDMQIQADEQGTVYDAMFMVANMFYSMEDYNSAGALYERGLDMSQNAGSDIDPQNYRKLADCYAKIGLQAKADETLAKAAKADPKLIDSIIESGNFEYQSGDVVKAIETYQSAVGVLPAKDADVYYHLGLAYQKLGDADKELEYFERAVAARPANEDAVQHLAEVLAYRKNDRPRAELYQDIVDGRGSSYAVQKEIADLCLRYKNYQWAKTKYTNAGRIVERKIGRTTDEQEIATYQQQLLTASVFAALADAYRGKMDEARAAFDLLATENPDAAIIQVGHGRFALIAGDPDAAVSAFQAALEKEPKLRDAAVALGEYYLAVGKQQQALEVWQNYIKVNRSDKTMWVRTKDLEKQLAPAEEAPAEEAPAEVAPEEGVPEGASAEAVPVDDAPAEPIAD